MDPTLLLVVGAGGYVYYRYTTASIYMIKGDGTKAPVISLAAWVKRWASGKGDEPLELKDWDLLSDTEKNTIQLSVGGGSASELLSDSEKLIA